MAQQSFYFRKPRGRNSYPIGPFNGGIVTHLSSTRIKDNQILDCTNFICQSDGLKRRPALVNYSNSPVDYPPIRAILTFWKTDGTQETIVLDEKFLYKIVPDAVTGKYFTYSEGTVEVDAGDLSAVIGSGTSWSSEVNSGDTIVIDSEERTVSSVSTNTSLTVTEDFSGAVSSGTSYEIRKAFNSPPPAYIDWTVGDNKIIIAPGGRPLFQYDGTTLELQSDSTYIPHCVTYFKDRLWTARIQEGSVDYRSRVRWADVNDHEDWSIDQYVDIPYTSGYIMRLVPFGDLLVVYFDTAIYLGYPTNYPGDTLPLAFRPVETGGVGLIAPRAVVPFIDSHFFVGQDDIYYWPANGKPERIGDPVVKRTLHNTSNFRAIQAGIDVKHRCILFGFPGESEIVSEVWAFNYSSGAWSKCDISCSTFWLNGVANTMTWEFEGIDVSGGWDDLSIFPSWESISNALGGLRLYFGQAGDVFYYQESGVSDPGDAVIEASFETKDYTFGVTDTDKTISRFNIKIADPVSTDIRFRCWYSTDRGRNWTSLSDLIISSGDDESSIGFLATGSTIRFKFESSSRVETYTIEEVGMLVKGRGLELHYGPAD